MVAVERFEVLARSLAVLAVLIVSFFDVSIVANEVAEAKFEMIAAAAAETPYLPTLEYVNATQVVWQIPADPKAVMFIAHACSRKAINFWDKSQNCAECRALPEEHALVSSLLARRYAVIAISSERRCWDATNESEKVKLILSNWITRKDLQGLPVVALGISSGGDLVTTLALQFYFQALVSMISQRGYESMESDPNYPPTMFVFMPKDEECSLGVKKLMKLLQSKGIRTKGIECYEMPLHPHFFSERIPFFNEKTSEKLFAVIRDSGWLNERSYLKRDSRSINWQMPVKQRHILPSDEHGKLEWEDAIQQELNLAYAYHSATSQPADQIVHWFDSNISNLVQEELFPFIYISKSTYYKLQSKKRYN